MADIPIPVRYGCHRVLEPVGLLPQAAWRIDSAPDHPVGSPYEILLDVERLNIDAASFRQMEQAAIEAGEAPAAGVEKRVRETVATRGKMHNPITGSGGMLLGRVRRVGAALAEVDPHCTLRAGDRLATLVSLSLTPLRLDSIGAVHLHTHQMDVQGSAILFASGVWARLPNFLPETAALSALDVAGAAPQVTRLCRDSAIRKVLVLGCGGKSGLLCGAAARRAGVSQLIGIESYAPALAETQALGIYDQVLSCDATAALQVAEQATQVINGEYDLVISCVSAPGAEMSAVLCTRNGGTIYFFSMATSFTAAALGAEGVSKDVNMLIGNGFCNGHAEATLELLRQEKGLRELFVRRYG